MPQGAATSCGLSTIAISHITSPSPELAQLGRVVMYADDGLIFLNHEEDLKPILAQFKASGVELAPEKSK